MPRDGVTHPTLDTAPPTDGITSVAFEFLRLEDAAEERYAAMCAEPDDGSGDDDDPELRGIHNEQARLLVVLSSTRAISKFDIQAKARVLDTFGNTFNDPSEGNCGLGAAPLVRSLVLDLLVTKVERTQDGELLHLSEQHDAAYRHLQETHDADDAVSTAAYTAMVAIEDQIEALPARTCAGLMVKAKVLSRIYAVAEEPVSDEGLFHQAFEPGMAPLGVDQRLVGGIMRDMVAMVGEAP